MDGHHFGFKKREKEKIPQKKKTLVEERVNSSDSLGIGFRVFTVVFL
jgi:hypothetical protein